MLKCYCTSYITFWHQPVFHFSTNNGDSYYLPFSTTYIPLSDASFKNTMNLLTFHGSCQYTILQAMPHFRYQKFACLSWTMLLNHLVHDASYQTRKIRLLLMDKTRIPSFIGCLISIPEIDTTAGRGTCKYSILNRIFRILWNYSFKVNPS